MDWKAFPDEITRTANRALTTLGLDASFEWSLQSPVAADARRGFHALHVWLERYDMVLVNFETGGDFYLLAIVPAEDAPVIIDAASRVPPTWAGDRPLAYEVPDDWATDPLPGRPTEPNPEMMGRRWVEVRLGPPPSWFVPFREPPHPRAYGAHRFEGPFIGPSTGNGQGFQRCRTLDEAAAFRDYAEALAHCPDDRKDRVVTLAEAQGLFDWDEYWRQVMGR